MTKRDCKDCPLFWEAGDEGYDHLLTVEEALRIAEAFNSSTEWNPEESWLCSDCGYIDFGLSRRITQAIEAGCEQEEAERLARGVERMTEKQKF